MRASFLSRFFFVLITQDGAMGLIVGLALRSPNPSTNISCLAPLRLENVRDIRQLYRILISLF
jgi:hypothetical protein